MDHASYGTLRVEQDYCASLSQLPSSRPFSIQNNTRFLLLDLIERLHTGRNSMGRSFVLSRDLIVNSILWTLLMRESILSLVDKMED
jgi:hypothetical protein